MRFCSGVLMSIVHLYYIYFFDLFPVYVLRKMIPPMVEQLKWRLLQSEHQDAKHYAIQPK